MKVGLAIGVIAPVFQRCLNIYGASCSLVTFLLPCYRKGDLFPLQVQQRALCMGDIRHIWETFKKPQRIEWSSAGVGTFPSPTTGPRMRGLQAKASRKMTKVFLRIWTVSKELKILTMGCPPDSTPILTKWSSQIVLSTRFPHRNTENEFSDRFLNSPMSYSSYSLDSEGRS